MSQTIYGAGSAGPTSIASGQCPGIAQTAVALTTSTPCRFVWLGAPAVSPNSDTVWVGGSGMTSSTPGIPIVANNYEGVTIAIDDASKIYVLAASGTQTIDFVILA